MSYTYQQDLGATGDVLLQFGTQAGTILQTERQRKLVIEQRKLAEAQAMAAAAAGGAPRASAGMPGWVIPVGIGAAALVLILALKKRR